MKNRAGKVLYVGKAKQLKARVRSYFTKGRDGREMVPYLTRQVHEIETIVVRSEKEALLLENTLIKRHLPKYNALLKDDKSFFSLMINHKHKWPMLKIARYKGAPPKGNLYFGPYTDARAARRVLELLRTLFPLRQCSNHELAARDRPCILYDIKKCVAPCVNHCTKPEYDTLVEHVIQFLKGKDRSILKDLKKQMDDASKALEFEKAHRIHKLIQSVEKTLEKQHVDQAGLQNLDVVGLVREDDRTALCLMQFREGKLTSAQSHLFTQCAQSDEEILTSFCLQHYEEKQDLPKEVILPLNVGTTLATLLKLKIHIPIRGNKLELIEMAKSNALVKLAKAPKEDREQILLEMEQKLHLTHFPERIECFDNSHISGSEPVSAMIVFTDGKKDSKEYRKYKVQSDDDYASMREVLTRRFSKAKQLPDLLIIDGGRGHLNTALRVLQELNISTVDVIGVAKEGGRHDKGMTSERVFHPQFRDPIMLKENSRILFLLQQIRDEAHRFAITFHKQRRAKSFLKSELASIEGIGPVKQRRLLKHFGSMKRIMEATPKQWLEVQGVTKRDVENLKQRKEELKNKESSD